MPNNRRTYSYDESMEAQLPAFLANALDTHSTSLGDNGAFPVIGDVPFDYKLIMDAYGKVYEKAKSLGFTSMSTDELETRLSSLISECKRQEKPISDFLVRECEKMINDTFSIPKESMIINYTLQDVVKTKKPMRVSQEDMSNFKFEDAEDAEEFNKEVHKRRVVNSITQGAASSISNAMLNEFGREGYVYLLKSKYDYILALNDYLLFTKKEDISEKNAMQGGYAEVRLGMDGNKTVIDVQGIIFPFLLREAVKGLFEAFSAHGLPKNKRRAQAILRRSDFLLAEPWDMRFGTELYGKIFNGIDDLSIVPYMFMNLVSLDTETFNKFMKDVLSDSKSGEHAVSWLHSISTEEEYDDSTLGKEPSRNVDRGIISDERIVTEDVDESEFDVICDADDSNSEICIVDKGGEFNYLKNGAKNTFLLDKWAEKATKFRNGFALVMVGGKWYFMDEDGSLWTPNNEEDIQNMLPSLIESRYMNTMDLDSLILTENEEKGCDASVLEDTDIQDIFFDFEDFGGMLYATIQVGDCRFAKKDGISLMAEPKPKIGENMFQLHISLDESLRRKGIATKLYQAFIMKCGDIVSLYSNRVGTYAKENDKSIPLDLSIDKIFNHLWELPNVTIEKVFSNDGKEIGISATYNAENGDL